MKKLHLKSILSMALMVCLMLSSAVVCYAYDGNTEEANATVLDLSVEGEEEGTPLLTTSDDGVVPYSGVIYGPNYTTTRTGKFGGTFTVPSSENNSLIKVHWRSSPQSGANSSAVFKLTVTGNGISKSVLLPGNDSVNTQAIDYLPAGTYSFDVTPYSNVKGGDYICVYQFYAY